MTTPEEMVDQLTVKVICHFAGETGDSERAILNKVVELILSDASRQVRDQIQSSPMTHRPLLLQLVRARVFQTKFRDLVAPLFGIDRVSHGHSSESRIFLSYHRDGGGDFTRHLWERLRRQDGFLLFLDQANLLCGPFPKALENALSACDVFVLVIAKGTTEKLVDPDDWVRRETEFALSNAKPIIPLSVGGFTLPSPLPEPLSPLANLNRIDFVPSPEGFEAGLNKLVKWVRSIPKVHNHGGL